MHASAIIALLEATRFEDLPDQCPYGFWVTPQSDIHLVLRHAGHSAVAGELLGYKDGPPSMDAYQLGWITIVSVTAGDEIIFWYRRRNADGTPDTKPSIPTSQMRTMRDLAAFYNAELRLDPT